MDLINENNNELAQKVWMPKENNICENAGNNFYK